LKGVQHPNISPDLDSVDDTVSVAPKAQRQFKDTAAKALQWLGDVGMPTLGGDGQRAGYLDLRPLRKSLEISPGRFEPRYRPGSCR